MTILERINNAFRRNTNPSPVIDEALYSSGYAYVDPLVFKGHNNFLNIIDKRASMYGDAIVNTLTLGWASVATTKTFKFYDSHEVTGQEVMQEWRAWWMQNNLDELLKAIIPHFCMDGRILLDVYFDEIQSIKYEVYGSYECDAIHWTRDDDNNVIHYNVKFVPFPTPWGWASGNSNCKKVDKEYDMGELLHFTRGDWNYGLGRSRVLPAWDSIVKLRIGSYADFFRRDLRYIVAVPEGWKKKRIESFAESFEDMMRGSRRMFVYKMEQSKDPSKTPLELPRFGLESLARPSPKPMSQSEAGGQLLRDPEWARLLSATRLTENYFIGNQAGAVTGSEVDLTRDFYTECEEFNLLEPVIKGLITFFAQVGLIPEPPTDYVIKYWKDWEHIEKANQLAEEEMMMGEQSTEETKRSDVKQNIKYKVKDKENSDYGERLGRTTEKCPRCGETGGKTIYLRGGVKTVRCPNCGHSWELGTFKTKSLYDKRNETYNHAVEEMVIYALRNNIDFPETPVSSTWIETVSVKDKRLWVKIPGWDKGPYAGYEFSDNETAFEAGIEMLSSGSKGGYMWDNIWAGGGKGPRPTQPGINEHIKGIHYAQSPFGAEEQVSGFGTFEQRKEGLLNPPEGFIGTEKTRRPLGMKETATASPSAIPSYVPFSETTYDQPIATVGGETVYTGGYEYNPQSITSSTKTGVGAKRTPGRSTTRPSVVPYNPTLRLHSAPKLNSQAYIMRLAEKLNWNMSKSTAQKIKELFNYNESNNIPRYNSFVVGNVMDFDIILRYPDNPNGEKACPKAWKKINAHEGDLYLYEDLGHGGMRYNVGKYKYWWDDKENKNMIVYNKEEVFEELHKLLNQWGVRNSRILSKISKGEAPDLSTEYYCSYEEREGIQYQVNFHNSYGDPIFEGIAIVERGNCSAPACNYDIIEEVIS